MAVDQARLKTALALQARHLPIGFFLGGPASSKLGRLQLPLFQPHQSPCTSLFILNPGKVSLKPAAAHAPVVQS
jgi:hypothetical protein